MNWNLTKNMRSKFIHPKKTWNCSASPNLSQLKIWTSSKISVLLNGPSPCVLLYVVILGVAFYNLIHFFCRNSPFASSFFFSRLFFKLIRWREGISCEKNKFHWNPINSLLPFAMFGVYAVDPLWSAFTQAVRYGMKFIECDFSQTFFFSLWGH